jgi:hypothetical protein
MGALQCSGCGEGESTVTIGMKMSMTIWGGRQVPISFCQTCAAYLKEQFPDLADPPNLESSNPETLHDKPAIVCTFCQKNQYQVGKIFSVMRWYRIKKFWGREEIYRVVQDRLFLATLGSKKYDSQPVYICGVCVEDCL